MIFDNINIKNHCCSGTQRQIVLLCHWCHAKAKIIDGFIEPGVGIGTRGLRCNVFPNRSMRVPNISSFPQPINES